METELNLNDIYRKVIAQLKAEKRDNAIMEFTFKFYFSNDIQEALDIAKAYGNIEIEQDEPFSVCGECED